MLRCGYRAEYILTAAQAVATGKLELESLVSADWVSAKKALMELKGIGEKVANCVVLFGLYHMEAFPIDVWIKRALKEHFSADFRPESLGNTPDWPNSTFFIMQEAKKRKKLLTIKVFLLEYA